MIKRTSIGVACLALAGCRGPLSMLEEAGPEAADVIKLWWILFAIGVIVLVTVTVFLVLACLRSSPERGESAEHGSFLGRGLMIGGVSTVVLLIVVLLSTYSYSQPFADQREDALTIEIVGKRWWWIVNYFDENGEHLFETANEIHMPAGVPVRFRLLSDDVIHSFWVPKLGGKVDLIRGRTNYMWLQADAPGVYRGQCAEFCGLQHAKMAFEIVARPQEEFEAWVEAQAAPAKEPATELAARGKEVFAGSQCANCHSIRGVSPFAPDPHAGPDLTHLASRRSLAAATVPNRRGHLGGWITDPQGIKPGNLMPAVSLEAEEFEALLHYLEGLE